MPEPEVIAEGWVNVAEGAEISGYNRGYVNKLMTKMSKIPEDKREIRIRRRTHGYDIWLPDLINYVQKRGHGPKPR